MESTDSSSGGSQQPQLPPGFRFHPTDEELVVHYLKKKASSAPLPVTIIAEVDLYKFDPWELPGKATFGEQEWYFFSPRDRKYPNGARPNRAATSGYWKATGTDKPILTSGGTQKIGVKKALVFYGGRPPKGIKTNWIMHEYRLTDNNNPTTKPPGTDIASKKSSSRLDDWVLCRIYKKNNSQRPMERDKDDSMDDVLSSLPMIDGPQNQRPHIHKAPNYGPMLDGDDNFFQGILTDEGINSTSSISHLVSSSSKSELSMVTGSGGPTLKRILPSTYWNEPGSVAPPMKRFHSNDDGAGNSTSGGNQGPNSIMTLLQQLPQGAPFNHQALLGSLGEGGFRQPYHLPGMNWNS